MIASTPAAAADPERGRDLYAFCANCHALEPTEERLQGPHLKDLIGRRAAQVQGFDYSLALERAGRAGLVWDVPTLARYLADPQSVVPGGFMAPPNLAEADRADIVAFLTRRGH